MIGVNRPAVPIVASEDWYRSPQVLDATATEATQEWEELLTVRQRELKLGQREPTDPLRLKRALGRGGVPPAMRAQVWFTFSGAKERMSKHPDVFEQLCKRVAAHHARLAAGDGDGSGGGDDNGSGTGASGSSSGSGDQQRAHRVLEQVEKDLRRTEVGSNGGKLAAMRRVLCAFASFNPDVGYVQGMNFIVVALLDVFDEPASFWMLVLIVQVW